MRPHRRRARGRALLAACTALAALACATPAPPEGEAPKPALTPPEVLCDDEELDDEDDFCLAAARVEHLLRSSAPEILHASVASSGVTHPYRLFLGFRDEHGERIVFRAKWKRAPWLGEGFNNQPRKEIAAYEVQKIFLDADGYVVPPTVGRCMPAAWHARLDEARPTFPETECVFGVFAYWLENVTPDRALDLRRFEEDRRYRVHLAALNLLTYLIDHRDSRAANFLVSRDDDRPRVFAIDNGLAFGGFENPFQKIVGDWSQIRVPALLRRHVERLRRATPGDLDRLAVLAQFERRGGELVPVAAGPPLDPVRGVRFQDGILQLGLTREEIDGLAARRSALLAAVDAGELPLF